MDMYQAIVDGFIWSLLWAAVISLTVWKAPQQLVHDYPKEIQALVVLPPINKKVYRWIIVPALVILVGYLFISVIATYGAAEVAFWVPMLHIFIMCMVWNSVDLLVMDWLIFCTIQPEFMILPGTKGHPAYKDYYFHFRGFLIGCAYSVIGGVVCGGIVYTLLKLFFW
ncbi:hypothetical protein [uncultured Trichococcus sp.]|uniref:hypothetical protein n=1 Tax=uncultured Trichococcus sp. TaxID=189665 RepID=UPI002A18A7D0|nr:hypothetical protein [uncultured Trichococcus sp.]